MSSHGFDQEAWSRQSIFWQLGNIGSEVGRALNAKRRGQEVRMLSAFYRGMDLINATVNAWTKQGKSAYELLIAREQFAESILTDKEDSRLEQYFMQFAIAERLQK
ncbi:MAG: hypothetical protein QG593_322 [Patescibacteria group bacterium]|jgi:hypothetical protein|nr:hypothetical protein [Patescibacteria group bacterium]